MRNLAALLAVCATAGAAAGTAKASTSTSWWEVVILTTHNQIYAKSCAGTTYKVEKEESKPGGYEVEKTFKHKSQARSFMKKAPGCEGSAGPSLEKDSSSS